MVAVIAAAAAAAGAEAEAGAAVVVALSSSSSYRKIRNSRRRGGGEGSCSNSSGLEALLRGVRCVCEPGLGLRREIGASRRPWSRREARPLGRTSESKRLKDRGPDDGVEDSDDDEDGAENEGDGDSGDGNAGHDDGSQLWS